MAMRSEPGLKSVGKTYGMRMAAVGAAAAADGGCLPPGPGRGPGLPPRVFLDRKWERRNEIAAAHATVAASGSHRAFERGIAMTSQLDGIVRLIQMPSDLDAALSDPNPSEALRLRMRHRIRVWLGAICVAACLTLPLVVMLLLDASGKAIGRILLFFLPAVFFAVAGPIWLLLTWSYERQELKRRTAKSPGVTPSDA